MRLPNKIRRIKRILYKLKRIVETTIIRTFPNLFGGDIVEITDEEANTNLTKVYPDVSSSSWCQNNIEDNPHFNLHIIISAYNVEKYINQCIDSILNQDTHYSYCITIINDGSTDGTREKLKKYESAPNVEILDQKNQGYSGARNTALKNIRGEYIMFVDSDDYLAPNAIETLMKKGKETDADLVQGSFNYVNERDEVIRKKILKDVESAVPGQTEIISPVWAKVFKSKLFKNLCFPDGYWFEDTIMKFIIVPNSNLKVTTSQMVYNYRVHTETVAGKNKNPLKGIDALYVSKNVLKDCQEHYKIDEYLHDHFLHQSTFVNHKLNITSLFDEKIRKNVFIILTSLYRKYFSDQGFKSRKFPIMQKALQKKDYKLYCNACRYYT